MNDLYGRPTTGLRISVTNDCNYNCDYCHQEGIDEGKGLMTPDHIAAIVELGTEFGINKVKITGGEPLLRKDLAEIVSKINAIEAIKEISLTTNGSLLADQAKSLKQAGISRVNISLDTLDSQKFRRLTKGHLNDVFTGIEVAQQLFDPVKLNVVITKHNFDEIDNIIAYAQEKNAIVQMIELVRSDACHAYFKDNFISLDSVEEKLKEQATSISHRKLHCRARYELERGRVELVRSMHNTQFCAHCRRIRLTAQGYLKPCLLRSDNYFNILSPVEKNNIEDARKVFSKAINAREPFFK